MTKQDLITEISKNTGIDKATVSQIVEALMETIEVSMANDQNIYLRGFGSFIVKKRARKMGRNITKNISMIVPEHFIPAFKPSRKFVDKIKTKKV